MKKQLVKDFLIIALLAAAGLMLAAGISPDKPPPTEARDFFVAHGVNETGAINLVSAIYLGYRAFDTMGETIVLLLAVSGVVFMLTGRNQES